MKRTGTWMALLAMIPAAWSAPKTDVIKLRNGDHLTGEIKAMSYGVLTLDTDDIGKISVEWDKIVELHTKQSLQVEMQDGLVLYGRVIEGGAPLEGGIRMQGSYIAGGPEGEEEILFERVARIEPLDSGDFRARFDASISLGYSFAQSTGVEVFNLAASIGTRNPKRHWSVELDSQLTDQDEGEASQRATLSGVIGKTLKDQYYRELGLEFSRNQELGLDFRALLYGALGRNLYVRPDRQLRIGGGLAASTELDTDGTERESLEALIMSDYRLFRLDSPKANVIAELSIYPSLTESGRVRGEGQLKLRWELIKDMFFEISLYDSYDNRPAEGAAENDWGTATSLGYTF